MCHQIFELDRGALAASWPCAGVLTAMRRLGFDKLLEAKPSRERDLVVAMVAGRIIAPKASKLVMTRAWADTTLADELGVDGADEDCLYAAMDWLIERQEAIEKRWPSGT
jgi:hypothetical protein